MRNREHGPGDRALIDELYSKGSKSKSSAGGDQTILFSIGSAPGATSSATSVPAGAIIVEATVKVTTPYPAGTAITLGQAGSPTEFQITADNVPTIADLYQKLQITRAASSSPVLAAVAGPGGSGAGLVLVRFVTNPLP